MINIGCAILNTYASDRVSNFDWSSYEGGTPDLGLVVNAGNSSWRNALRDFAARCCGIEASEANLMKGAITSEQESLSRTVASAIYGLSFQQLALKRFEREGVAHRLQYSGGHVEQETNAATGATTNLASSSPVAAPRSHLRTPSTSAKTPA